MSRNPYLALGAAIFLTPLSACSIEDSGEENVAAADAAPADPMASNDDPNAALPPEDRPRPVMQAQVVLDRLGFTPGVVDGKMGLSTVNAIKGGSGSPVRGCGAPGIRPLLAQGSHLQST